MDNFRTRQAASYKHGLAAAVVNLSVALALIFAVVPSQALALAVAVQQVNAPPVANDDAAETRQAASVIIPVLDNDIDPDGNLERETTDVIAQAANGAAAVNADGTVLYSPDDTFIGVDSFVYEVCDSEFLCDSATVRVTVRAANAPPVAVDDSASTVEDTPVTIKVLDNDSDPDGDSIEVVATTQPNRGVAALTPDGTITYTPDPDFNGVDTFTYTICDPSNTCATATVSVAVTAGNEPPVANDDTAATDGAPVTVKVLDNDDDPDGDILAVIAVTQPAGGTVARNSSGTVTYTPAPAFCGTDSFTYTIADGNGGTDTATVTIDVQCTMGGFVTGGGWIVSPRSSCKLTAACRDKTGRASFGFVSKYHKGENMPRGSTEFQFQAGGINFHGNDQMRLTVSGPRAQFAGSGTVNRAGDYGMIVTVIDGKLDGTRVDKFRMKIWNRTTGVVVYDNQLGASDSAAPTMPLRGGSIMIHKSK